MDSPVNDTEAFSVPKFHWLLLSLLAASLAVCIGSLCFAALHQLSYSTPSKFLTKAELPMATIDDLARVVLGYPIARTDSESAATLKNANPKAALHLDSSAYVQASERIVDCAKTMSIKAGVGIENLPADVVDGLAKEMKRIAEASGYDRGASYVADAAQTFCQLTVHPAVIDHRRMNPNVEIFEIIINVHLNHWDQVVSDSRSSNREMSSLGMEISKYQLEMSRLTLYLFTAVVSLLVSISISCHLFYSLVKQNTLAVYRHISLLNSVETFEIPDESLLRIPMEDKGNG
jgi:hypothetical protein